MNALADDAVGTYLNEHFVSSFQKVATFRIANGQKQGGNVASYYCTPENQVLHIIAGPVNAATKLREARWIVEAQKLALLESDGNAVRFHQMIRNAHADRLRREHKIDVNAPNKQGWPRALNKQGQVHLLLAAAPLVKVEQVYKLIFEKVLGEKVSTSPVVEAGE